MLMGIIWTGMILVSILYSCAVGTAAAVGDAAIKGAEEAVRLCLNIGGIMCLWCAVMELMRECKIAEALARALKPILRLLFPEAAKHGSILEPLSANVGANLLGLGNAATPMGMQAAKGMAALGKKGEATNELCRLVVLNTASIQLLPTTVAAIRAAEGAVMPFDILPAVWISSAISVAVGLAAAYIMQRTSR